MSTITIYEGTDEEMRLPARWELCGKCRGGGTQDCFTGGMTSSELDEAGDEFIDDYLAGHYSVPCSECGGRTTVAVVDEGQCNPAQLAAWQVWQAEVSECRAAEAAEARAFRF